MTLYRKYRPQKFSEMEGQTAIIQTLKNELSLGKIAHAYIFAGPRGIGKTTVARILAKAINCQNKKSARERRLGKVEPCNRCASCQEITSGRSLDLVEIDAASNRGINEIRALRENVRFAPQRDSFKVYIIDEAHMLTREAFNALLKTLEEPPPHTLFILATTEVHEVPETILSRCQRFDFKKLTVAEIEHRLTRILREEKRVLNPEILRLIAIKADGGERDAEGVLGQILSWPKKELKLRKVADFLGTVDWSLISDFVNMLASCDSAQAIRKVNETVANGQDLFNFTDELVDYLRRMMLAKVQPALLDHAGLSFSSAQKEELVARAQNFSLKSLAYLVRLFMAAKNSLDAALIPQLSLELAIIEYSEAMGKVAEAREKIQSPKLEEKEEKTSFPSLPEYQKPTMNLEQVVGKWNEVLKAVEPLNYSLCAFLKLCQPVAFRDGSLVLGFPRDFHKDMVSQARNKKTVEGVLDQILGGKWQIQCEKVELQQNNNLTKEALEVLGGEIVK
ncbi:MAG: DNA polymerase III subunit gamma/tau [Patescibacteria group bacterium]|nr:DNA polymerase III subunit gamma/tau [Patescibacteria group bacterium]